MPKYYDWKKEGECPKCGAPIYANQRETNHEDGPSVKHTCDCRNKPLPPLWSYTNNLTVPGNPQPPYTITNAIATERTPVVPLTVGPTGYGANTMCDNSGPVTGSYTVIRRNDPRSLLQEEDKK